jgi:hypothetical protein
MLLMISGLRSRGRLFSTWLQLLIMEAELQMIGTEDLLKFMLKKSSMRH